MRRWRLLLVPAVFGLQIALLTIGLGREYRLKHEDNNALHATFARSHLVLGLGTTQAQNYLFNPRSGTGATYAHHPPAPGLTLAFVYALTGRDDAAITRATAVLFHLLATWLFYRFARRLFSRDWEAVLATLFFVMLPQSTFFGRMLNHEVMVLPAAILLVRGYWESVRGEGAATKWIAAMIGGAIWATLSGWAGFFTVGACFLHAGWERMVRHNPEAGRTAVLLAVGGALLLTLDLGHIVWVLDGDATYLQNLLVSRMGSENAYGPAGWMGRIIELHWRYFGVTSLCALIAMATRGMRSLRDDHPRDPAVETGLIFLIAGAGYIVAFNTNAAHHDYWQFLLLPASAIGLVLVYRWLVARRDHRPTRTTSIALLVLVTLDVVATSAYTLQDRHRRQEAYCVRVVAELQKDGL